VRSASAERNPPLCHSPEPEWLHRYDGVGRRSGSERWTEHNRSAHRHGYGLRGRDEADIHEWRWFDIHGEFRGHREF